MDVLPIRTRSAPAVEFAMKAVLAVRRGRVERPLLLRCGCWMVSVVVEEEQEWMAGLHNLTSVDGSGGKTEPSSVQLRLALLIDILGIEVVSSIVTNSFGHLGIRSTLQKLYGPYWHSQNNGPQQPGCGTRAFCNNSFIRSLLPWKSVALELPGMTEHPIPNDRYNV